MALHFHKMHGAGNDFVLIDARGTDLVLEAGLAARIADRHRGIGCDQIMLLRESTRADCLLRYEIWNADGSPAAQCGNGARCVGLYLVRSGESREEPMRLESPSGPVSIQSCADGEFEIEMGVPDFTDASVMPGLPRRAGLYQLESPWGLLELATVSMGNPHALLVVADIDDRDIPAMGTYISTHEAFPSGCNAGFAEIESRSRIRLRVVERGAGETLACGSGACAAVAILRRSDRVGNAVSVRLPGGELVIRWRGNQEPLSMKGPAEHVFRGIMND